MVYFTFLGFVFIGGKSRQGRFQLQRKTRRDRMRARLRAVKEQRRRRMHQPIPVKGDWLRQAVTGFFAYHRDQLPGVGGIVNNGVNPSGSNYPSTPLAKGLSITHKSLCR